MLVPSIAAMFTTRKIKYGTTKQLTFNEVAGTWQSTAGDQATVRDDQLVTIQNKSYVRGKVENLPSACKERRRCGNTGVLPATDSTGQAKC